MARHSAARSTSSPESRTDPSEAGTRVLRGPWRGSRNADPVRARPGTARTGRAASSVRRAVGFVGTLLLLGVLALALAVAVVPVMVGGSVLTVVSPSMTPTYPVGTLVVTRPRPAEQVRMGDVVSFTDRDPATGSTRTVTHRVVGLDPGPSFQTRGDANAVPDPDVVAATDVRGVVWYSLPAVGGWGTALRTGPGLFVGFGAVLILVALMLLVSRRHR